MLARDGHGVTVLERDAEPAPPASEDPWDAWPRTGVVQFRQPHFLQARLRHVLARELPDVLAALVDAGAAVVDPIERIGLPSAEGDERFVSVTARRPTTEHVFATAAEQEPGVTVRRGVEVAGLTVRQDGPATHVTGIRTRAGDELRADLVVDAMGRNSRLPRWLRDAGVDGLHEEAEDSGFLYYTRFFRGRNGAQPEARTPFLATPLGSISLISLPSDRGTWSVTLYAASADRALTRLKDADRWSAVVSACPAHAHWLDGEPLTGVLPMAGVLDRVRRLAVGGRPTVTGLVLVADAWACTNPSLARGVALGLAHAARLRDTVREHAADPRTLAEAWDAVTEEEFTPWYRATVATDRARLADIDRLRTGAEPPPPPSDPAALARARLPAAAPRDPDLYRAFLEVIGCLTLPSDVLARPGIVERVIEVTADGVAPPPGPGRKELLALLG
jgi:2-polyprenyl-6-methoxyphenol hydroxylase-like FAD-dependent oxidoreductase